MSGLDYRGLAALDAIVDSGSFERAALKLSLSQPAVSHRLRALEEQIGELLLIRSQPPRATERGQRLIGHYRQVRLLEAAQWTDAADGGPAPELAIAVNADSAATWLPEALAPLLTLPSCLIDVRIDDQDHTLRQLREGRVVACVTSSTEAVAGTTMVRLGTMRYHCVASAAFARRWFERGFGRAEVERAPALIYDQRDALHSAYLRQQLGVTGPVPHHTFATSEGFVAFIEAGHAYGMVPMLQAQPAFERGTLVDLTPGSYLDVVLTWHCWSIQTALTRTLTDQVVATAARWLLPA
jgi:LysR family transcriptional regulator (chromosome initiation inhibitor)